MEDTEKRDLGSPQGTPDLSKAREEFEKEVENSEMGAEMLDYGKGGPGAGRDDSSLRSEEPENGNTTNESDVDTGAGTGSTD